MKKMLAVVCALVVVAGVVTIFSVAESAPPAQEPVQQQPSATTGAVYYLNFKPEQSAQWEQLAKAYTQATGVPVTVVTAASGTYEDTLRSEVEKNQPPTLFQVNGPIGLQTWQSYCLDLTDTAPYQHLKNKDFALEQDGQVLGVAYAIETYGLIYNHQLLDQYCQMENAVIEKPEDIRSFATLKAVAQDIQARKEELGVQGAFTSAGMDSSSDWRFKTHLANLPVYYEYQDRGISSTDAIEGTYLPQFHNVWDLYIQNATCAPTLIGAKTGEDALSEFTLGEAVFYQNGTWVYDDLISGGLTDEQLGMLPIYIGVDGEENQGLCTGSENYWCINKKAGEADIQATKDFLEWLVTSDQGRDALANQMGFVTPFDTFGDEYAAHNALLDAANAYMKEGRQPVGWTFTTMPSETWKNNLGAAMLEYAQGTGKWEQVEKAFVDGWKTEAAAR